MESLLGETVDARSLSPLTLAFVGDAVYELLVREHLANAANRPPRALHEAAVAKVSAPAQAAALQTLLPWLTERERAVCRRGRNAHTARSDPDYHSATALETLFGYWYLTGRIFRAREMFLRILQSEEPQAAKPKHSDLSK